MVRNLTRRRTLKLLTRIQPTSGGFLEATPLTSFVCMSLAAAGNADHAVVRQGVKFLIASVRDDGSWPIDTNLATWVTTLAVNALANHPDYDTVFPEADRKPVRDWLLDQQYRKEHPYTLANPGGWAWTELTGGVPDADDTPGALLALKHLGSVDERVRDAAAAGIKWLLGLQNRDGGIPTFCKGWGKLPFDKSSADLTAHAGRAFAAWHADMPNSLQSRMTASGVAATNYLARVQQPNGAWMPLWFGNQHLPEEENPLYGTTRVLRQTDALWAYRTEDAIRWLLSIQNGDGGWGAGGGSPSSIEETALAIEALAGMASVVTRVCNPSSADLDAELHAAISRGVEWLVARTQQGTDFPPTPIGFYFAKLWYWEKLYPLVWTVSALGLAARLKSHALRGAANEPVVVPSDATPSG